MSNTLFILLFSFQIAFGTYFLLLNTKRIVNRLNAFVIYLSAALIFSEYYIFNCNSSEEFLFNNHHHTFLVGMIGMLECICTWFFANPFEGNPKRRLYTNYFIAGFFISFILVFTPAIFTDQVVQVFHEKVEGKWAYQLRFDTLAGKSFMAWYAVLIFMVNMLFYISYKKANNQKERKWKFGLLLVFMIVPVVMFILFVFLPSSSTPARYEIGIFYSIVVIFLSWFFSNFKLFDVTPIDAINDILASTSNLITITDHNFKIKYSNEISERDLIAKNNFKKGDNLLEIFEKSYSLHFEDFLSNIKKLKQGERFESSFSLNIEGEEKNYFFVVTKIFRGQDLHTGYTFVGIDISSLVEKEKTLLEYTNQLEKTNNELERFAYIASHDLKTPLRNVNSFLSLLRRELVNYENKNVKEYIEIVQFNAKNMYHLIEEILEYSKVKNEELDVETVDMNEVIESVNRNIRKFKEEKNAVVDFKNLPAIMANPNQMLQLFQNIIENGIKYNTREIPHVIISSYQEEEEIVFEIQDNGIGISQEYHDSVFEIFKRLHNQADYQGSGVGLAICKRIVENHNGSLTLVSKENFGSTFIIRLKVALLSNLTYELELRNSN